jgi:WD40 repeat protein
LWDASKRKEVTSLNVGGKDTIVGSVIFSPDGKLLASGSEYGIRLWALYPSMGTDFQAEIHR